MLCVYFLSIRATYLAYTSFSILDTVTILDGMRIIVMQLTALPIKLHYAASLMILLESTLHHRVTIVSSSVDTVLNNPTLPNELSQCTESRQVINPDRK
jgi:hypothetical protein